MSLNEEVFVYFMGTLHLVIYLVCGLGTSEGTCSSGDTVTSWSEWTCNIENSIATRTSTGNCKDNEHVSETVKVTVYSWTSWSPWSPTCGGMEVYRSHSCVVPSTASTYCSTCGFENTTRLQSKPSNLPSCCKGSEYTIVTMNSESTELSPSGQITMTDTSMIVTTLASLSWNTPPPTTVYSISGSPKSTTSSLSWNTPPSTTVYSVSGSPKSTASPQPVSPNSTKCPSSSLPCTPPSANVPVYIWVIIGVSVVGVTTLMVIGAILMLSCCYVKRFRQQDDEGRSPLLSVHEYQDELGETVLFDIRDYPKVDEDTIEGEFVDVTDQVGEKKLSGIELPYEGFPIEEKRNPRAKEYKNIKTTSEKRPGTKRRSHPKLFDSDEDDEMLAL